jgi:hypothetical protein
MFSTPVFSTPGSAVSWIHSIIIRRPARRAKCADGPFAELPWNESSPQWQQTDARLPADQFERLGVKAPVERKQWHTRNFGPPFSSGLPACMMIGAVVWPGAWLPSERLRTMVGNWNRPRQMSIQGPEGIRPCTNIS